MAVKYSPMRPPTPPRYTFYYGVVYCRCGDVVYFCHISHSYIERCCPREFYSLYVVYYSRRITKYELYNNVYTMHREVGTLSTGTFDICEKFCFFLTFGGLCWFFLADRVRLGYCGIDRGFFCEWHVMCWVPRERWSFFEIWFQYNSRKKTFWKFFVITCSK